jgi:uncharacterized membrane protein
MAHRTLVISVFESEEVADRVAARLKDDMLVEHDAVGVMVLDDDGRLKVDKVGARSTGKGVGIGAVLWLLGPVGMVTGLAGGAILGAMHHQGLGLADNDRDRISKELEGGRAAVGVLTTPEKVAPITAQLDAAGGATETHATTDEALEQATAEPPA